MTIVASRGNEYRIIGNMFCDYQSGLTAIITFALIFTIRFIYLSYGIYKNKRQPCERNSQHPVKTVVVIGSGGHTAEMLKIIQHLDYNKYRPRVYVMASNDITSEIKIISHEYALNRPKGEYRVMKIPRCRNVGQSYFSSVFTTIYSTIATIPKMLSIRPELILCNGPGTCIPLCLIAFLMKVLFICDNKIVFIESICRVKSLSVTGYILLFFADVIYVQWPELVSKYPRVCCIGNVM